MADYGSNSLMKKDGRGSNTPSKMRMSLQAAFSRSQSTSNVLAPQQRLATDLMKFPETLMKQSPLRSKLFNRNASVPSLQHEPALRLARVSQPQGVRSVPTSSTPVFPLKGGVTPQRKNYKTPPKCPSNPLLTSSSTPLLLKQKYSVPDLKRPPPLLNIDFETESGAHTRSVSRRKGSRSVNELAPAQTAGRKGPSNSSLGCADSVLPNTVTRICFKTRTGSIGGRPKPHNQDNYLLVHDFNSTKNQRLFAVFDGHGIHGHEVSTYIKTHLAAYLDRALPKALQGNVQLPVSKELMKVIRGGLISGIQNLNQDLVRKTHIDTSFSGSTAIIVIVRGTSFITANIGDSRAILGRKTEYGWKAVELSHDQKPDNPEEMARIQASGGRVQPFIDPNSGGFVGPARVWMQQEPAPGLAMSRSIGDFVASQIGVVSEPEVLVEECRPEDKFLMLASDGVWEFMPNQRVSATQCVDLIAPYWEAGDIEGACEVIVREAVTLWRKVCSPQEDEVEDDITVLMAFLAC